MISMNLVFHVAAAVAFVGLVVVWLRLKRRYDFLLELLRTGQDDLPARVYVDGPKAFLARCAEAFGVVLEDDASGSAAPELRRIDPRPWAALFTQTPVRLLRWTGEAKSGSSGQVMIELGAGRSLGEGRRATLEQALGGDVTVQERGDS